MVADPVSKQVYVAFRCGLCGDKQSKTAFFRENRFVHWGEGDFGSLVIEGEEEPYEVFGEYVHEIRFEARIDIEELDGYLEITDENLGAIRHGS